jgi:hypothetical protein
MVGLEATVPRHPKGFAEQLKMGLPGKYGRGSVPKSLSAAKNDLKSQLAPLAAQYQRAVAATNAATKRNDDAAAARYSKAGQDTAARALALGQRGVKAGFLDDDESDRFVWSVLDPKAKSKKRVHAGYR